ncbi:MAG: hypothetical protein ACI3V2_10960 [Faecousia sp.]
MTTEELRTKNETDIIEMFRVMCDYTSRESDDFLEWLPTTDFFSAPASTRFHSSYSGGLAQHSLNVYARLDQLCSASGYPVLPLDVTMVVGICHDLCKTGFYKASTRPVKENGQWTQKNCWVIDDEFPFGHGEKSAFLASQHLKLSNDELLAIRWHMGAYSDPADRVKAVWRRDAGRLPLALNTHLADIMASHIDENDAVGDEHKRLRWDGLADCSVLLNATTAIGILPSSDEEHYKQIVSKLLPQAEKIMQIYLCNRKHSDFFTAPATADDYSAFTGGLCRHSLRMFYALCWVLDAVRYEVPLESVAKVALMASIGAVDTFTPEEKKYQEDGEWKSKTVFRRSENLLYGGLGEKSVYQLQAFMPLTRDEALAIRWHQGVLAEDGFQHTAVFDKSLLAACTHIAYMIAAYGSLGCLETLGLGDWNPGATAS